MIVKIIVFFKKKDFVLLLLKQFIISLGNLYNGEGVCVCGGGDSYNLIGSILFSDHKSTLIIIENKLYNLYILEWINWICISLNGLNQSKYFLRINSML